MAQDKAPDARREALAKQLHEVAIGTNYSCPWEAAHVWRKAELRQMADWIIADRERREGPLVRRMDMIERRCRGVSSPLSVDVGLWADIAMREYAALDAPPARTLERVVDDIVESRGLMDSPGGVYQAVPLSLLDELAALRRKEG